MKQLILSTKGSVMLEFILVLPLYLVLYGGTFLTMELSIARIHIQEANRNLAWLAEDRYCKDKNTSIAKCLRYKARQYYDERNNLENRLSLTAGNLYGFGDNGVWGYAISSFKEGSGNAKVSIEVGKTGSHNWIIRLLPENKWCNLYTGNMELQMRHVSAAYIGAIAANDVLYSDEGTTPFYMASYQLGRAPRDAPNGEALLIHRKDSSQEREKINTASLALSQLVLEGWPIGEGLIMDGFETEISKLSNLISNKLGNLL